MKAEIPLFGKTCNTRYERMDLGSDDVDEVMWSGGDGTVECTSRSVIVARSKMNRLHLSIHTCHLLPPRPRPFNASFCLDLASTSPDP